MMFDDVQNVEHTTPLLLCGDVALLSINLGEQDVRVTARVWLEVCSNGPQLSTSSQVPAAAAAETQEDEHLNGFTQ